MWYNIIKRWHHAGLWTSDAVNLAAVPNAQGYSRITVEQAAEIIASKPA